MTRAPRSEARAALASAAASIGHAALRRLRVYRRRDGSVLAMRDPDFHSALAAVDRLIALAGLDSNPIVASGGYIHNPTLAADEYAELASRACALAAEADRVARAFDVPAAEAARQIGTAAAAEPEAPDAAPGLRSKGETT